MIPDFQTFMRPLLHAVSDGAVHDFNDAYSQVCQFFGLTQVEVNERLPSGRQTVARTWARTYMGKAGLLVSPKKRHMQITERGLEVLKLVPDRITVKYLKEQFPEFAEFHQAKRSKSSVATGNDLEAADDIADPSERLESAHAEIQQELADEVLAQLKQVEPLRFETMVVELMKAMGYGGWSDDAAQATQYRGDDGIDGVINEDPLGLDTIYLQAKRYTTSNVQRPEIDAFIGALTRRGARKGVFITTSGFSPGALEAVRGLSLSVVLIDGQKLASLMIAHNLGVSIKQTIEIKALDTDYFVED